MKSKKIIKRVLITLTILIIIIVSSFFIYVSNYYHADKNALNTIETNSTIYSKNNYTVFNPKDSKNIGMIFYPGGKVEDKAYAPLLKELSNDGITCILIKMPFNLAVFDINAANDIYDKFPEIKEWYISGHSLGGAMASSYASKNTNKIKGIILLGAYPTNDIDIKQLIIYGSNDLVVNRDKLNKYSDKIEIPGGNHAYFGDYGEQKSDGKATITRKQQQSITVKDIKNFIFSK